MKCLGLAYQHKLESIKKDEAKQLKTKVKMLRSVVAYIESVSLVDDAELAGSLHQWDYLLSLLRDLEKRHGYSFARFLEDEGRRSGAGDEIAEMWRDQILCSVIVRLAQAKDTKKLGIVLEIVKVSGLYIEDTV
jgi:hypothetical protein